jgi:hypothetical protein
MFLAACGQQPHHQTPSDQMIERLLHGMELTYVQVGIDTALLEQKEHRNLAYRLALHLLDHPQRVHAIDSGEANTADLHQYAQSCIQLVQGQRPGYPVLPIMTTLLDIDTLDADQQLLLLACSARLLMESGVVSQAGSQR